MASGPPTRQGARASGKPKKRERLQLWRQRRPTDRADDRNGTSGVDKHVDLATSQAQVAAFRLDDDLFNNILGTVSIQGLKDWATQLKAPQTGRPSKRALSAVIEVAVRRQRDPNWNECQAIAIVRQHALSVICAHGRKVSHVLVLARGSR